MRSIKWFGVQLAVLSVCCGTWAQANFQTFSGAQSQQIQQAGPQSSQFPDVRTLELQQQQFRDSVAQAVRERQQISTEGFQQTQQRKALTGQQRRPVVLRRPLSPTQQPLTQPQQAQTVEGQVSQQLQQLQPQLRQPAVQQPQFPTQQLQQQPQLRQPAVQQPQFPTQQVQLQEVRQNPTDTQRGFTIQQSTTDTQRGFTAQHPVPTARPQQVQRPSQSSKPEEELLKQQNENAQYSFGTSVVDSIMDNSQVRSESRNGLQLQGMYSYSDGFFKRTVHYEADQNGYRVVKEEVMPIGEGPQLDLDGRAEVDTNIGGIQNHYSITAADIPFLQQQ